MAEQTKTRPVHELRIGSVKAAILRNDGSNGPWHGVSFKRVHRDGNEWNSKA